MSAYKLRQGKSKEMNHWLRARVALQGVTVAALLVGSMHLQKASRDSEAHEAAEAKRTRERVEFEKRLLEAERATEQEEKFRRRAHTASSTDKKKSWWWPWSRGT